MVFSKWTDATNFDSLSPNFCFHVFASSPLPVFLSNLGFGANPRNHGWREQVKTKLNVWSWVAMHACQRIDINQISRLFHVVVVNTSIQLLALHSFDSPSVFRHCQSMASPGDDNGQASPLVVAWMTEYACTCKIPGLCEALMPSFTEVYTRQDQLDVACRDAVITSHLRLCLWTLNGGELDPESEETHSSILSLRPLVKENDIDGYVDLLFLCKAQILINCAEQERFNYSESNRILGNLIVEDEDSQTDDAYSNAVDDRVDQLKDDFRELFDMLHASRKKRKAASAGSTAAFLKSLKAKYSSEKFSKELSRFCSMWDSALSPCFLEKLAASGDPSAFGRSSGPSMEHLDAFLNTKLTAQELRGSLHSLSEQRWLNIHSRRDEEVVDFIRGGSRRTGAVRSRKSVRTSRRALDFDGRNASSHVR